MVFRSKLPSVTALSFCLSFTASGARAAEPVDACLLTKAEFAKVVGREAYISPESTGHGTVCGYDSGQIVLYLGKNSRAMWDATMKAFHQENAKKIPVPGVGDNAYAFYTIPENEYQSPSAFVVFGLGEFTVAVSVDAEKGKTGESMHDKAVTLAKIAAGKLK